MDPVSAKVISCLQHGRVTSNLHFAELNPHVDLDGLAVPGVASCLKVEVGSCAVRLLRSIEKLKQLHTRLAADCPEVLMSSKQHLLHSSLHSL